MAGEIVAGGIYGRVYCVTNTVNGKRYIGQTTKTVAARWVEHQKKRSSVSALNHAINKYGAVAFRIEEVETALNQAQLDSIEIFLIAQWNTISPRGYNIRQGGNGGKLHDDTKKKLCARFDEKLRKTASARMIALWETNAYRAKQAKGWSDAFATGEMSKNKSKANKKVWSDPVFRERMLRVLRDAKDLPETKKKMSVNSRRNWQNPEYIKKVVEAIAKPETKRKQAEASKAMWARPGHREKFSEAMRIRRLDPKEKEKCNAIALARWQDPEFRRRHAEGMKAFHDRQRNAKAQQ